MTESVSYTHLDVYKRQAQCRVILDLAAKGPCVIVGRCADAILPDAVHLFIYAGMDRRRERIAGLHPELSGDQVENRIVSVDRKRCLLYPSRCV